MHITRADGENTCNDTGRTHTFSVASTAAKLYDGGIIWPPSWKECVTWNCGFMDMVFVKSARAPSNMKFVNRVTVIHDHADR